MSLHDKFDWTLVAVAVIGVVFLIVLGESPFCNALVDELGSSDVVTE
jgi:hypothetical protein